MEPTPIAYLRSPELVSAGRQSQDISLGPPLAANRPGEVSFPISGNHGRRHCLVHSGTTRVSPFPFSSPRTPSSSREPFPLLDFDRDSPREKNHFARRPPSAAKLAAGSSIHPRDRNDYQSDRLDPLNPQMASVSRTVPPFTGEHRRSSRLCSARGRGGRATGQT